MLRHGKKCIGTHREVQETPRNMEADRLEALGEAGRESGRGAGAFKDSEGGGSGDPSASTTIPSHTSSHKVIFQ